MERVSCKKLKKLQAADIFIANGECSNTDHPIPQWCHFQMLGAERKSNGLLEDLGVTVASLANNHIID